MQCIQFGLRCERAALDERASALHRRCTLCRSQLHPPKRVERTKLACARPARVVVGGNSVCGRPPRFGSLAACGHTARRRKPRRVLCRSVSPKPEVADMEWLWRWVTRTGPETHDRCARPDCVFCGIANGRASGQSHLLHEDSAVVAFEDRSPAAGTHILVCPRAHILSARHLRGSADAELGAWLCQLLSSAQGSRATQPRTCKRWAAGFSTSMRLARSRSLATTCRPSTRWTTCTCTALRFLSRRPGRSTSTRLLGSGACGTCQAPRCWRCAVPCYCSAGARSRRIRSLQRLDAGRGGARGGYSSMDGTP